MNNCPLCNKEHELQIIEKQDICDFKEEKITYLKKEYYCKETNEKIVTPELEEINQLSIKDEYRKKHNLLTSSEIK